MTNTLSPGAMPSSNLEPTTEDLTSAYERMCLIRQMEQQLERDKAAGNLPGTVHLYIGQEAIGVGVCAHLNDDDFITSNHRGHGHFLAKGGDPKAMLAEIWTKKTGICRGMGGSMHVADVSKGILGANGIVGGGLAIATGAGFGCQLDGKGAVSVCFFGDGAANQGVVAESLNIAALWKLPVIFVCENNAYSEFSHWKEVTAGDIYKRAEPYGVPTSQIDGNDFGEVWRTMKVAVERARTGGGPTFVEAMTYRIHGHSEGEPSLLGPGRYREDHEIEQWRTRDPLEPVRQRIRQTLDDGDAVLSEIDDRIRDIVAEAAAFAIESDPADPELSFELMFHNQPA